MLSCPRVLPKYSLLRLPSLNLRNPRVVSLVIGPTQHVVLKLSPVSLKHVDCLEFLGPMWVFRANSMAMCLIMAALHFLTTQGCFQDVEFFKRLGMSCSLGGLLIRKSLIALSWYVSPVKPCDAEILYHFPSGPEYRPLCQKAGCTKNRMLKIAFCYFGQSQHTKSSRLPKQDADAAVCADHGAHSTQICTGGSWEPSLLAAERLPAGCR